MAESSEKCDHKETRQSAEVFGMGAGITQADADITGSRLPTNNQVLRCYMFHQREGLQLNRTKYENAKIVLKKIIPFYNKGNIPIITEKKACEKIIILFQKNAKLRELPVDRRSSISAQAKIKETEIELGRTFQIWAQNAEVIIKNEEDLKFLQSMKTDRAASFGSWDKKLASQLQRKEARVKKQEKNRLLAQQECELSTSITCTVEINSSERSSSSETEGDIPFQVPAEAAAKSHCRVTRTGTTAFIPHNILKSPKIVSLATRMKLSPSQQAAFTQAIIEESGGDASKVSVSYATADRSRRTVNKEISHTIQTAWAPPKFASLHWDSKLMINKSKNESEERLAIAIGNNKDIKLLGVPAYKPGTDQRSGDIIAQATVQLLQSWNCVDSVVNMTFDTTASNTGHVTAACITLQQSLGRALLWSACRHHVGELILTQVFNDLNVETSKSGEYMIFSRFKKHFDKVPHGSDETLSSFDKCSVASDSTTLALITEWQEKAVAVAEAVVQHQREDYKEFTELCLLYLDNVDKSRSFKFHRPGAVHKARWMAKILYAIKVVLLEKQISLLPKGTITTVTQQLKLRNFVNFVCLIYSRWWITSTSAVDAPWHDLCLYNELLKYSQVDTDISNSGISALNRHLWYLCSEMIPLALFSDIVSKSELQYLAEKLLTTKPATAVIVPSYRFDTGFGKPKCPVITSTTRLGDLISVDSWFIIHLLEMNTEFLHKDVDSWPGEPSFLASKAKTVAVNVVNDSAERAVKLSSDYLDAARSEQHYQNILQVVEADRKQMPCLRKRKRQSDGDDK